MHNKFNAALRALAFVALTGAAVQVAQAQSQFTLQVDGLATGATLPESMVFDGFGCKGGNHSPALRWSNPPAGTKSYAVTVYDPDAPTGSGWWHWVVFNIPASATGLPADFGRLGGAAAATADLASAVQSRTDFGTGGFGGACPPAGHGPHHYVFTVYALKTDKFDLKADAPAAMVGFYINGNNLGAARVQGTYSR